MKEIDHYYWRFAESPWTMPVFGLILLILKPFDLIFAYGSGLRNFLKAQRKKAEKQPKLPAVIVPGCGLEPDLSVSPLLKERLDRAVNLLQSGKVETILLSGDCAGKHYDEIAAMKEYLIETCHVSAEKLIVDPKGFSTKETMRHAQAQYGIKSCYIATNDFHMPRCLWTAKLSGIDAYPDRSGRRISPFLWGYVLREKFAVYQYTSDAKAIQKESKRSPYGITKE